MVFGGLVWPFLWPFAGCFRLTVLGLARPDAPPELGKSLAQARAVNVRQHLLSLLEASPGWQEEIKSRVEDMK